MISGTVAGIKRGPNMVEALVAQVTAIGEHWAPLPLLDDRTLEEILYDGNGLPK
jgi:hypothetical protein